MEPIYITDFSVDNDKFSFTVPQTISAVTETGKYRKIYNKKQIDWIESYGLNGTLFDEVFIMYVVDQDHVILKVFVDKCHVRGFGCDLIVDSDIVCYNYECFMSSRGIMIQRVKY